MLLKSNIFAMKINKKYSAWNVTRVLTCRLTDLSFSRTTLNASIRGIQSGLLIFDVTKRIDTKCNDQL